MGPGGMGRFDQDYLGVGGWDGNFGFRERLLYSGGTTPPAGPITLQFSSSVIGVGAQIQANLWGDFTANIQAFDAANGLLGSYFSDGMSSTGGGDSAIFIGILSDTSNISKVVFDVTTSMYGGINYPHDFAINGPSVHAAAVAPVPLPGALVLFGSGLLGLVGIGRKRFKK